MCSDDARTPAEGIFEVSTRRDSSYTLGLVTHCVIPFMFDVKLAQDDNVVPSLMALMTDPSSKRESESCDHVFVVSLPGIDIIVHTRKVLRHHLHKSTWFYVIIKHMCKQWILGGTLSPSSAPGIEAT